MLKVATAMHTHIVHRLTHWEIWLTRKYPLRRYFLGVLTHTTAWDRLWGSEQTQVLVWNSLSVASLVSSLICLLKLWPCGFRIKCTHLGFASVAAVWLGYEGDPRCIFFTHDTYQASFISDILWYCCRNWSYFLERRKADGRRKEEGQTDVEVEIVI